MIWDKKCVVCGERAIGAHFPSRLYTGERQGHKDIDEEEKRLR